MSEGKGRDLEGQQDVGHHDAGHRDVFGRVFRLKAAEELRQRDVAAWNRAYVAYGSRAALADERQAALQAAIEAGWIEAPAVVAEEVIDMATGARSRRYLFDGVEVGEMRPSEVNYYGMLCSRAFDAVMAIPKGSSST